MAVAIAAALTFFLSNRLTPEYEASATLLASRPNSNLQGSFGVSLVTAPVIDITAYQAAATSSPVLRDALGMLDIGEATATDLRDFERLITVRVENAQQSSLLHIAVKNADPAMAARSANALSNAMLLWDTRRATQNLQTVVDTLESQLVYAWRRQLAALVKRMDAEVSRRKVEDATNDSLPLPRALGFVDMVAFTSSSARLGSRELAQLVQGFEFTARDVITSLGARVVKTIGDAVLFVADDLPTAARVAIGLITAIEQRPELLPVRASLVWGRVLSRSGDVFGPIVNLASRLVDIAPARTVLMDPATSERLAAGPGGQSFSYVTRPAVEIPGIGEIAPVELRPADEDGAVRLPPPLPTPGGPEQGANREIPRKTWA